MAGLILGLIAKQGGGKGSAADIIKKRFAAHSHRFSDPVREMCDAIGWPQERPEMIEMGQIMRRIHGEDVLEQIVILRCRASSATITIADGIREPGDIRNLLQRDDFRAIYLEVSQRTRFERLKKRAEKESKKALTWEAFLEAENHKNELAIDATLKLVKKISAIWSHKLEIISNEGLPEDLEKSLNRTLHAFAKQCGFSLAK